jgi:tRNA(Arg) A34 adenosine deaminase TadA
VAGARRAELLRCILSTMDSNAPGAGKSLVISVPSWLDDVVAGFPGPLETDEDRMALAIALSRSNVERGGGPFGALVFLGPRLVGAGVNRVLGTGFSIAHAEIIAIMLAQQTLALAGASARPGPYSLIASTEPCCQCFGALVWSGIDRLVCGATTADAEAIGFDEGPKPDDWVSVLRSRDIAVTRGVRSEEARAVLAEYLRRGGTIYGTNRPSGSTG